MLVRYRWLISGGMIRICLHCEQGCLGCACVACWHGWVRVSESRRGVDGRDARVQGRKHANRMRKKVRRLGSPDRRSWSELGSPDLLSSAELGSPDLLSSAELHLSTAYVCPLSLSISVSLSLCI